MKISRFAVASALAACAFASYADTYATFKVEGRGLPVVEGVVRDTPKVEWGFVNFIAFGAHGEDVAGRTRHRNQRGVLRHL